MNRPFLFSLIVFWTSTMTSAECTFPDIDTTDWTSVETSAFALLLPPELRRLKVQGYDSLVGKWQGDDAWITYDFGPYSGPQDNFEDFTEVQVCIARIDDREAKVATYRRDNGELAVSAYWADIGHGDKRLAIYGEAVDEVNRNRLLAVVAQVRFLRKSLQTD
jgi:hypothetical protein